MASAEIESNIKFTKIKIKKSEGHRYFICAPQASFKERFMQITAAYGAGNHKFCSPQTGA